MPHACGEAGPYKRKAAQETDVALTLKIARIALALSALLYASTYLLYFAKIAGPLTCLVVAGYSAIGLGLSAAACVGIQGCLWVRNRQSSNRVTTRP